MDPPQLIHPDPRETNEDGTAIIKAAEHKSMNIGDSNIKSQRTSNNRQRPQLIVAATTHLIYMITDLKGPLDHAPPERKTQWGILPRERQGLALPTAAW